MRLTGIVAGAVIGLIAVIAAVAVGVGYALPEKHVATGVAIIPAQLAPSGSGTRVQITENGIVYNPLFRFVSRYLIGHTKTIDDYLHALGKRHGADVETTLTSAS